MKVELTIHASKLKNVAGKKLLRSFIIDPKRYLIREIHTSIRCIM